jgi:lipopolysaccharide export system protein LptA
MPSNLLRIFTPLALALCCSGALAERADRDRQMNYEADALNIDDIKQVSVLTGSVVITKGTLVVRAERVEVRQDPSGYDSATATAGAGKRVTYRQKRDTPKGAAEEFFEGSADTMTYDGKTDVVRLIGNAQVRRLRGAQVNDEAEGALIVIDNASASYTITGGVAGKGATPENPKGRVQGMFSPRQSVSAPATTSGEPLKLESSKRLGGTK